LFYRRGLEHTSFANIAAAVRISRGNFPFVAADVVRADILEIAPSASDQRLAFPLG
jgi:hypothetical protein